MAYPKTPAPADQPGAAFGAAAAPTPSPNLPGIEEGVLAYWATDGTFQASIDQREGGPEWVFNDGPPFANGLPHYFCTCSPAMPRTSSRGTRPASTSSAASVGTPTGFPPSSKP